MNLSEKMNKWEELKAEVDAIEDEIKAEVLALAKTQKVGKVTATYSAGRGSYDYEQMAMRLEPEQEVIDKNTKPVTDWRKVCEDAGATDELKEKFYKPGTPYVSLKLDK